jgi:hypothetical protein
MEETRAVYRLLVRKLEGKRPLRRPSSWLVHNIRMVFVAKEWSYVHWISPAQERYRWRAFVNAVMKLTN